MRMPILAALSLSFFAGINSASAQQATNLSFAHWLPASHDIHAPIVKWTESIRDASGGTLTFKLFPAQQLGNSKDHYAMAKDGIADFSFIGPGYTPGQFPIIAASELPFMVANATGGSRALDEWYRRHNRQEMRDVHYCMALMHDPGSLHAKKPITSPADIKGLKVRPANATLARFFTRLGGASVHIAIPEARDALAKGVADAITMPWNGVTVWGLDSITTHHTDFSLYSANYIIVMNKAAYAALAPEQKKVIDKHCSPEWAERIATPWAERESHGREKLAASPNQHLHKPSAQELEAWTRAADASREDWAKDVARAGQEPKAIYADLVETLRKHGALYQGM